MKKIITLVIFLFTINLIFSQDNRKMLDFYKNFYELNFNKEDSIQNQKFNNLFVNNLFKEDFKTAIYALFINKQIGNEQSLKLRTLVLIDLLKKDKNLDFPIYKMKGNDLHNVFKESLVISEANVSKIVLFETEIEKQNKEDKIFIAKSYFEDVQSYLSKYSSQKK